MASGPGFTPRAYRTRLIACLSFFTNKAVQTPPGVERPCLLCPILCHSVMFFKSQAAQIENKW